MKNNKNLQFYFLLLASFFFTIGEASSLPYMSIFLQENLNISLSVATAVLSSKSICATLISLFIGALVDKIGRKKVICISLIGISIFFALMCLCRITWQIIILLSVWGILNLSFQVGANTMIADISEGHEILERYSIYRIVFNIAYSMGPIIGGFIASKSYNNLFLFLAFINFLAFLPFVRFTHETKPKYEKPTSFSLTDFTSVLKDKPFLYIVILNAFTYVSSAATFNLLSSFAFNQYQITEEKISIVFTINAIFCVLLQMPATKYAKKRQPLSILALAAFFYAIGCFGFSLYHSIVWYCISITGLTVGEVLLTPTNSELAASMASPGKLGVYMSLMNLSYPIAQGPGLSVMGYCYDHISPVSIWYFGSICAIISLFGFQSVKYFYRSDKRLRRN